MRQLVLASCLASSLGLILAPSSAFAAPGFEKPTLGPVPSESSLTREQALATLVEGEAMLQDEATLGDGMSKMLDAYIALESIDGAEARGVKELRSWLIKALETIEFMDEAAILRARGSYVDQPLSVMPSTWFAAQQPQASTMSLEQASEQLEVALDMLGEGNIEGLSKLITIYEVVEQELGPESEEAKTVRSFLVGLLEAGGFQDEANNLRARGSVTPATDEDNEVYLVTWLKIIEAEGSADSTFGAESPFTKGGTNSSPSPSPDPSPSPFESNESSDSSADSSDSSSDDSNSWDDDDDDDDYKSSAFEPGSVVPSLGIDLGLGTWQPDSGRKGFIWLAGINMHWTLFTVNVFGMQLGGGGRFGRNRDKRWLADAHAELRLPLDFSKLYLIPEFGGGYDQVAGGDTPVSEGLVVGAAPYYHYGGTLGVRIGYSFGMYGRAVRLHRDNLQIPNETRVRAGFLLSTSDEATIDFAFVYTDYDEREGASGSRLFAGAVGLQF